MKNHGKDVLHAASSLGKCPFKRLNKRLQQKTKKNISTVLMEKQAIKHRVYIDILKRSFEQHEQYYTHIQDHITGIDTQEFSCIQDLHEKERFLNRKIKDYFWKGFLFESENMDVLQIQEATFVKIGNLGLDDVTMIVYDMLLKHTGTNEDLLHDLDEEMDVRMRNNVLIDGIIHLDDFADRQITKDKERTAHLVQSMIEKHTLAGGKRFSKNLIPSSFVPPMTTDGMIDEQGVIPQITFGCPIVNLQSGRVFKLFVKNFVRCFLASPDHQK